MQLINLIERNLSVKSHKLELKTPRRDATVKVYPVYILQQALITVVYILCGK